MTKRAGCIIYYNNEFLLVHHSSSNYWGFPKGRLNAGELPEVGAIREVHEETGLLLARWQLGQVYRCKDSRYFIVQLERKPAICVDGAEIDNYIWVTTEDAHGLNMSIITKLIIEKIKRDK